MSVPCIIETTASGERAIDIYAKLLQRRIIYLNGDVTDESAGAVAAQMLFLHTEDAAKPIYLLINSPGGSVTAGMGIFDMMHFVAPEVWTVGLGQCASMAALLLCAGTAGRRYALPSTRVMIHQPLGGARGRASDIGIHAREILRMKDHLNGILAERTGKDLAQVKKDTEKDHFMEAQEALDYGLIDQIVADWGQLFD